MRFRSISSVAVGILVGALYVGSGAFVAIQWLAIGEYDVRSINHFFGSRFVDMVDGRAYRPFVTRALVPGTIRMLREHVPPRWQTKLQRAVVRTFHLRQRMAGIGWEPERSFDYLVFSAISLALLVGVLFATRAVFRALFASGELWAHLAPLPLLLIPLLADISSMYDPATLTLAALATWTAITRRTRWFYVVYVLAVLNKETAFLFAALFLIIRPDGWRRHALPLAGTWLTVRLWLSWAFRDNPGGLAWWIPDRNVMRALADPWGVVELVGVLAVVSWSVWRWRSIRTVRCGVPLLVGVLLAAYLAVGVWGVYRIFLEAVPLTWVTLYAAALSLCRVAIRARDSAVSATA
jgi:hypothetical protein